MGKRVIDFKNFKDRGASHSMTGFSRAYAEVLPENARPDKHSHNSLEIQKNTLSNELVSLQRRNTKPSRADRNRINSIKGTIGNINKTLSLQSVSHWEEMKAWIFWRISTLRMPHETFREIDMEAEKILISQLKKAE